MNLRGDQVHYPFRRIAGTALVITGSVGWSTAARAEGKDGPTFGLGESPQHVLDGSSAMFMVGLAVGVVVGAMLFALYRKVRDKETEGELDLETWMEGWEKDFPEKNPFSSPPEDKPQEKMAPWERPPDWWKDGDGGGDGLNG